MDNNSPIKIVITTRNAFRHQYFLSKACELFGKNIAGIFLQASPITAKPSKTTFIEKLKEKLPYQIKKIILSLMRKYKIKSGPSEIENLFEHSKLDYWRKINAPVYRTNDINNDDTQELLKKCAPDLILVFGGKILKGEWLTLPKFGTINMHSGILPYFRSCNSAEFAIYQENFHLVGATLHYVDAGVDTGAIISKHYVDPANTANLEQLKAKVIETGVNALLEAALKVIETQNRLDSKTEKWSGSYYPHSVYRPIISNIAGLRLQLMKTSQWPYIIRAIQNNMKHSCLEEPRKIENGIYIFLYHGIVDSNDCEEWENVFDRIKTEKNDFIDHIKFLKDFAEPAKLSQVPELLNKGPVDKPYFVITFDDGYVSLLKNALPICEENNVFPTVFAIGEHFNQKSANYRILLAVLLHEGYANEVCDCFNSTLNLKLTPEISLLDFTKNNYQYQKLEKAVLDVWYKVKGSEWPKIHLNRDELFLLNTKGWEIGNHTFSHCILSKLNYEQQKYEIEENIRAFEKADLDYIKWLSYPYGSTKHVNQETYRWMKENPDWHGILAIGGVNRFCARTEWLRIGISQCSLAQFKKEIFSRD